MLNRFKYLLSGLILCSGFSVGVNANEEFDSFNTANNSVAIIVCLGPNVLSVTPLDFQYASSTCSETLSQSKHYGWDIEFTQGLSLENIRVGYSDDSAADDSAALAVDAQVNNITFVSYTLIKQ